MDLIQKFEGATSYKVVSVIFLERNRKYPILRAKRITTRIVPIVFITIRDSLEEPATVLLSKRHSEIVKDSVIEKINTNAVYLNLAYQCV